MTQPAFVQAMNVLPLLEACEWLAGPGRWIPRASMGSFPLRFPHQRQPDGLGWHVEGSYLPDGEQAYGANFRSRDRALLALFLFTDIDEAATGRPVSGWVRIIRFPPFWRATGSRDRHY